MPTVTGERDVPRCIRHWQLDVSHFLRGRGMAQSVLVSRLSQLIVTLSWPLHYKLVMAGGRAYALGMNPYFLVLGA